jgi:hypothetical protein
MPPWSATSFAKHNKHATMSQLEVAARVANEMLERGASEGHAVAAGNAAIQNMRKKKGKRAD